MPGEAPLSECESGQILCFIIHTIPDTGNLTLIKFNKIIPTVVSGGSMSISQLWCHINVKRVPHWLPVILIILSNDIHLNPGYMHPLPHTQNKYFNFMSCTAY